jgi:hypothetical protein
VKAVHPIPTTLFRVISVLCGIFFLFVPRREMVDWSSTRVGVYYAVVVGYIVLASVRSRKVSQSMFWTTILCCLSAVPLLLTMAQVVISMLKFDLAGTDVYTWAGLLFVLVLEALLPIALVFEFRAECDKTLSA